MSEANDLVRLVEDSMKEADMHTAVGLYGYVSWEEVLEKRAAEWLARERARWQAEAWDEAVGKVQEQHPACEEPCEMCAEMDDWLHAITRNPYRESEATR